MTAPMPMQATAPNVTMQMGRPTRRQKPTVRLGSDAEYDRYYVTQTKAVSTFCWITAKRLVSCVVRQSNDDNRSALLTNDWLNPKWRDERQAVRNYRACISKGKHQAQDRDWCNQAAPDRSKMDPHTDEIVKGGTRTPTAPMPPQATAPNLDIAPKGAAPQPQATMQRGRPTQQWKPIGRSDSQSDANKSKDVSALSRAMAKKSRVSCADAEKSDDDRLAKLTRQRANITGKTEHKTEIDENKPTLTEANWIGQVMMTQAEGPSC